MNGFVYIPSAQSGGILSFLNRHNGQGVPSLSNGDTITATLTGRDGDRATLRTADDFVFTTSSNSLTGDVGNLLHFKVIKQDKSGLALKQVFPNVALEAKIARGNAGIEDVSHVSKSLEQMNEDAAYRAESGKEEQVKTAQALAGVRRAQRFMSGNSSRSIIAAIAAAGLDINKISFFTLSNVIQEVKAMPDTGPATEALSDAAVASLIRSGKEITAENIYAVRYSTDNADVPETPAVLEDQVLKHFELEGIENNPRNVEAARFLLAHDLPITRHNVESAVMLRNLDLIPKAIEAAEQLPYITGKDVEAVLRADYPLDIEHLKEADSYQPKVHINEESVVTAQRQLAEVQWQMTVQAALRLAHKGIEIDTEPLANLVEHLRALEQESFIKALNIVDGVQDNNNMNRRVTHMENIFRVIQDLRPGVGHFNSDISAKVLVKQVDFTLAGMHSQLDLDAVSQAKAVQAAYDTAATLPSARYGDSFAKVMDQFEGLLSRLGIEPTAESVRAAAILSRNEIDISQASLEAIKAIDAKITAVMDRLHPMMAAQMLKDGLQPLDMQVDEMLAYIRKFEERHGFSATEKVAQHIYEMDRNKALSPEERSGMVAVYRMLNVIQKNGAAALGLALKQDSPLTLGSLMEAARFFDGKKYSTSGIRAAIAEAAVAATPTQEALSYTDLLADSLADKATPDNLSKWLNDPLEPIEDVLKATGAAGADISGFEPDIDLAELAMRQFTQSPPSLISLLQKSGILPTPEAVKAARIERENALIKALKGAVNEIRANNPGLAAFIDGEFDGLLDMLAVGDYKEVTEKIWNALSEASGGESSEPSEPSGMVKEAMDLLAEQYALASGNDDNDMDIPIRLNGELTSLKVYTLNENAVVSGTASTLLALATEGLGAIQSFFNMEGDRINIQFAVENPAARVRLEANIDSLAVLLAEVGYNIGELTFTYLGPEGELATDRINGRGVDEDDVFAAVPSAPAEVSDYEFVV